jgi:hypothetical protein
MKPFRFSLTFSVLASVSCLLVLTWILLSLISFKTAEKDLFAQKIEEGRLLLAIFNDILPISLAAPGTDSAADKFADRVAKERGFVGLLVVNGEGGRVYLSGPLAEMDEGLREALGSGRESSLFAGNGRYVYLYAPVRDHDRIIGASRLALSLYGEHERLMKSRHLFLAYFILDFILLLGFGSFMLSRIVVAPVRKLLSATERIAAGDYVHPVHVPGSAEIADLSESFNTMQEALRKKRDEVESHVASLEKANRDIQAAREETIRSEKMASIGLLAAGMAHEIGTPLAAIIGYTGILSEELAQDPEKADYLRRIAEESTRMDRIVRGLLDYARPNRAVNERVEIAQLLHATIDLLAGQGVFKSITTSLAIDDALPTVYADPHQLQQALINLLINARDAMPSGGRLGIRAALEPGAPGGGSFVRIEISDSGEGIAPENLARIFDPFFTTKEPGKGTGLGLAIAARIIESFGGRITAESGPGEGISLIHI